MLRAFKPEWVIEQPRNEQAGFEPVWQRCDLLLHSEAAQFVEQCRAAVDTEDVDAFLFCRSYVGCLIVADMKYASAARTLLQLVKQPLRFGHAVFTGCQYVLRLRNAGGFEDLLNLLASVIAVRCNEYPLAACRRLTQDGAHLAPWQHGGTVKLPLQFRQLRGHGRASGVRKHLFVDFLQCRRAVPRKLFFHRETKRSKIGYVDSALREAQRQKVKYIRIGKGFPRYQRIEQIEADYVGMLDLLSQLRFCVAPNPVEIVYGSPGREKILSPDVYERNPVFRYLWRISKQWSWVISPCS